MGFLDRLFGRSTEPSQPGGRDPAAGPLTDEQALERYRYLVRTAPPDAIERAHADAFAALTPEQRRQALQDMSAAVPEQERAADDDPRSLARMATRAELNRPGTVERAFGGAGGMLGGTLLASFAGAFVGTAIAQSLWDNVSGEDAGGAESDQGGDADAGSDADAGADAGDAGGDFGGGDFGGGDFGGGDVGGF